MKVAIDTITEKGIFVEEDIIPEGWDMDSSDVHFLPPVHCEGTFISQGKNIYVKMVVVTRRSIICARCLEHAEHEVKQIFDLYYSSSNAGEYIDVDADVREHILLEFPMKVLCFPECKGICHGCGVNLNTDECKCVNREFQSGENRMKFCV